MKLLLISPKQDNSNGGIAVWTDIFLDNCAANDICVRLLNTAAIGARLENGSAKRNILDEIKRTAGIFRSLKRELKAEKYDAFHLNTSCGEFGIIRDYLTAKRIKKKQPKACLVVQYHCDIPVQIRSDRAKKYLGKLLSLADKNLVLCTTSAKYLKNNYGKDSVTVPNFMNEKQVFEGEREINPEIKRAFFVGRVQKSKGAPEIYELARRMPDIEFRLAGAVSSDMAEITPPKNVTLLGPTDHDAVLSEMDLADIFIFPSHTEGFSVALMESMARGLPAVATSVGANADMLSAGCGSIVPVGDVDGMVSAIEKMAARDVRESMSKNALARVRKSYVTSAVMERFVKEYKGI